MHHIPLPPVFEPDFYREHQPHLANLSDEEALEHYRSEGIASGYIASPGALRGHLLSFAGNEKSILEIGPFHAPSITGNNVRYMDVLTTDELKDAVRNAGHDTSNVPQIDYVAPKGGFDMVDRRFSAVFSGHCIEHQPDFIRHFQGVSSVLEDGGRYYIACPDKRFCFDHYAPESTVSDVLAAYHANRRFHHPRSFIVQRLHRAHNDAARHWSGDHGPQPYVHYTDIQKEVFSDLPSEDVYHDTHAWQFVPASFFQIMSFLYVAGLTDFAVERVYHTRHGSQEFTAVLRKGRHAIDSATAFVEATPVEALFSHLKNERVRTLDEIEKLEGDHIRAKIEIERLKQDLNAVFASRSWAVTRPLRRISGFLRRH